jgi:putative ABC transport system permease protein
LASHLPILFGLYVPGKLLMITLAQDLKFALRMLAKSPSFTAVAVLTLALAIGANTAIFSVVKAVLLNSLPYRDPSRLVTLAEGDANTPNPTNVSFGTREDWKARNSSFESIALYWGWWTPIATGGDKPEIVPAMRVSYDFFPTLCVQPLLGRGFAPEDDRPDRWHVLLLSYSYWMRHFAGNPNAVGQTILLDQTPFQIVGVLPESFQSLSFGNGALSRELWAPLGYAASQPDACRSCQHLRSVARLKAGVSVGRARAEMNSIATQLVREFPKDYPPTSAVVLRPLQESWLGNVQSALWLLLGATSFVLLIACANMANLLLSKAAGKRREVALRAALGASRWRIVRLFLTESILISLFGGVGGIILAIWGTNFLVSFAPARIPRLNASHFDGAILLFTFLVTTATGVLMGLMPALQASRVDHREALQSGARGSLGFTRNRFRNVLVVSEVALAFVLTVASGLLLKSFWRASHVDPGFNPQNLFTADFRLSGSKFQDDQSVVLFERETLDRVRSLPGVQAAAISSVLPITGALGEWDQRGFHIQDRHIPDTEVPSVDTYFVSPDYLRVMEIPVLRGRSFTDADAQNPSPVALISESTARQMWPGGNPLGERIQLGGRDEKKPWSTIVGIVSDVHQYGLDSPVTPQVYELYSHNAFSAPILVVRSSVNRSALTRAIQDQLAALDRDVPLYNSAAMSDFFADSLAQRRFTMQLLSCFGLLALLLAALGIYGVMSYGVQQRTGEIGVRLALGAQPRSILKLVASHGMLLAGLGLLAGAAAALSLTRVLASQLFAVSASDPVTFVAIALFLAIVAFSACYVPARRATRVDPMVALRYE